MRNTEHIDKFSYLKVTLESTGGWTKQKTLAKAKGYQAVLPIDLVRESRRGKCIGQIAKCWYRITC